MFSTIWIIKDGTKVSLNQKDLRLSILNMFCKCQRYFLFCFFFSPVDYLDFISFCMLHSQAKALPKNKQVKKQMEVLVKGGETFYKSIPMNPNLIIPGPLITVAFLLLFMVLQIDASEKLNIKMYFCIVVQSFLAVG